MPELADVEGFKRYLARYGRGRRVRAVRALDGAVLRNVSASGLGRALHGRRLGQPIRHGKWLQVPAGDGALVLHFGMTGSLAWTAGGRPRDRFDRVVLEIEGGELRYRTARKLGGSGGCGRARRSRTSPASWVRMPPASRSTRSVAGCRRGEA